MTEISPDSVKTTVLDVNKNNFFKVREFSKEVSLQRGIDRLSYGMVISKIKRKDKSRLNSVCFYISDEDVSKLQWISSSNNYKKSRIDLCTITSVSESLSAPLHKKLNQFGPMLLTVFYGASQELLLIFKTAEEKMEWWAGLEYFITRAHHLRGQLSTSSKMTLNLFGEANQDNSNSISKDELKKIIRKMQISVDNKTLDQHFETFDHDKNGKIDMKEFEHFIQNLLQKKELLGVFIQYSKGYKGVDDEPVMTPEELVKFYKQEQKTDLTEQEALGVINQMKKGRLYTNAEHKKISKMSFYEFSNLIFSDRNLVCKNEHHGVYMDMTRPLTDYYMQSSHNTYLIGNQLTGTSSIKGYIRALELGCRSVEIDLWNGDNAEPIVTHGHTLTSKILFKDLVVALKEHAFVRSDYPLVLSFEMHCDLKGQQKIASILEAELKDQIYVLPPDYHTQPFYPSPESLRRKFLIKSKGTVPKKNLSSNGRPSVETETTDVSSESDEPFKDLSAVAREVGREGRPSMFDNTIKFSVTQRSVTGQKTPTYKANSQLIVAENRITFNPQQNTQIVSVENRFTFHPQQNGLNSQRVELITQQSKAEEGRLSTGVNPEEVKTIEASKKKQKKIKSSEELAKYYTLLGTKINFDASRSIWEICSLSEEKIKSLSKSKARQLVDFCNKYFVRTYPVGSRIDSSNYDPVKAWTVGAQMVALNYQTSDESMLLNWAKFSPNGTIGYVLKPEYLTSAALLDKSKARYPHEFTTPKLKLRIKIISGQQFQFEENTSTSDIIDPFVEVKIRGHDVDEAVNPVYKTHTIQNNGFNPIWSDQQRFCEVEYTLVAPELATLVAKVYDADLTKKSKLAWCAIEIPHLAEGYRVLPMLNSRFDQIPNCYLLVHVQIDRLN